MHLYNNYIFNSIPIILCLFISNLVKSQTQTIYSAGGLILRSTEVVENCSCSTDIIGPTDGYHGGISFSPEGILYGMDQEAEGIWEIDLTTGAYTMIFASPSDAPEMSGMVAVGGGIFYSLPALPNDTLYKWDINTGTVTAVGSTGWWCWGEVALMDGNIYYIHRNVGGNPLVQTVVLLDVNNPSNSQPVVSFPSSYGVFGITASLYGDYLIGSDALAEELVLISLIDGAITPICSFPYSLFITSPQEHAMTLPSVVEIDLDCNDSSGATEADFNSPQFDCLSDGVPIADEDIKLLYDALITSMTITIAGNIPDAPLEILEITTSIPGISVSGNNTDFITLTNTGSAKSTDFKDALHAILYRNSAILPTGGLRTIEVQFTTESGAMSNVATAFIEVIELPLVEVDLGPDQEACEGETATFDAGNLGADFEWSNGATSQTITVDEEDEYIVTVSDGINCPNQDTVELDILPVIQIALTGDTEICDNEQVSLTLNTDAPFPIDVEITSDPGSPFTISGITGNYNFTDLISDDTEYMITNVVPSMPACIEISDPEQLIDVYPSYIHSVEASICDGDSIWLGFYWETEPGVYENTLNTFEGCDSVVTTTVNVLPAINISIQSNTCDSSEAGVFVEYLNNPNGCDTVITTTVSLLSSDTTLLMQSSCRQSETGVFTLILSNQQGCDSIVITNVTWSPPADTTFIGQTSCDSSQLGITQELLTAEDGCDSLVITSVTYASVDTTYFFATSCDNAQIGVTQQLYTDPQGCDSLVITTVTAAIPDTSYAFATSCDSSSLGVIEMHFVDPSGCDSVAFTTVTYSASDSTFLQSTSCNPSQTGIFVDAFINQFGCDSIVTTIITLLPSNEIFLQSTTCDENQAGVFTDSLTNSYGCDSIVITSIELLPSDQTSLSATTCRSSDAGVFINNLTNQFGCDSIVTLTVSLVPADTTVLTNKTCIQEEVGSIETTYTNQDGCDSLVIEQTILHDLPELQFTTSDYNGYGISCMGETDGSIDLQVSGTSPFEYIWSTHATTQSLTGLSAGAYAVTVTDANGCNTSTEIILFDPEPFSIGFEITHPDCFDANAGSITVQQTGGIEPVRYTIDGINYQPSPVFENLTGGMYEITAIDANECETKEILLINVPLMVSVNLGEDMQFFPGDTAVINAIVNVPYDSLASVQWSGLNNTNCPTCLSQTVTPIITTTYTVSVTTHDGCADEDALTLFVENDNDVYVPNIFSPDGDGVNDVIVISAGSSVEQILEFVVFDRWGNVVYADDHFEANDVSHSWDGRMKRKELNPGVFAYKVIIEFTDGQQDVVYGDITLLR